MLTATAKYLPQIKMSKSHHLPAVGQGSQWISWISFADVDDGVHGDEKMQAAVAGAPTATGTKAKVEVLKFFENTGRQLQSQVEFRDAEKARETAVELP